jgi:hypothetical protein
MELALILGSLVKEIEADNEEQPKSRLLCCSKEELQSASGKELSALMPSVLDKAFKGEL